MAFYDRHIHPSSPHRSVLSVHVTSQVKPTSSHLREQLVEGIKSFVASEGYDIPAAEVAAAVQGDLDHIPQKLFALITSKGYDKSKVEMSMARGAEMLKAQTEMNGVVHSNGGPDFNIGLKETRIEDIQAFKKTLTMDEKPMPVQPLETFYESGSPKL